VENWVLRIGLAAAAGVGVAASDARLPNLPAQAREEAFVPDPGFVKLTALGFDAAIADLHWMRAVQIVGSEEGAHGRSSLLGALIDVVTTLDPWVGHPYRFAAVWMRDDETAVRKANELLRRGIEHHPRDWRNYFYLAFNHFFYLGESEQAAEALEPALDLEGAPPYLKPLCARLHSQQGGLEASAAFLQEMLKTAAPLERAPFLRALMEIDTERRARLLDAARAEYVRRHKRDIERVEDLVSGGVLRALPEDPYREGWTLASETGEIVSRYLRYRYEVKIDGTNRLQLDQFHARAREAKGR
jgi:tetratricopeptide (TPR) repeat protein